MDLSTKFGKEFPSRNLREKRSESALRFLRPALCVRFFLRVRPAFGRLFLGVSGSRRPELRCFPLLVFVLFGFWCDVFLMSCPLSDLLGPPAAYPESPKLTN